MGEMTLADIAAVTDRDNNAFGGNNGGMWIFALLILLMMGGGYWNRGNQNGGGEPVTESGKLFYNFKDFSKHKQLKKVLKIQ